MNCLEFHVMNRKEDIGLRRQLGIGAAGQCFFNHSVSTV